MKCLPAQPPAFSLQVTGKYTGNDINIITWKYAVLLCLGFFSESEQKKLGWFSLYFYFHEAFSGSFIFTYVRTLKSSTLSLGRQHLIQTAFQLIVHHEKSMKGLRTLSHVPAPLLFRNFELGPELEIATHTQVNYSNCPRGRFVSQRNDNAGIMNWTSEL
jgi:hypothetical protein